MTTGHQTTRRIPGPASGPTAPCAVIGGGPAGLVTALALNHFGVPAVLVARRPRHVDNRTTALLGTSITALEALGVWEPCRKFSAPLRVMRIADDTRHLVRAPEVHFDAAEIGLEAFGWNIENVHLVTALWDRVAAVTGLTHLDAEAREIDVDDAGVTVTMDGEQSLRTSLAIAADGRNSICRAAAGIDFFPRIYPQVALTFNLSHSRDHHNISTEFHTENGPFTVVPLPGMRSSLVCVTDAAGAAELSGLSGAALDDEIERRSHSILGKVVVEPGHGRFPMAVATASRFGASRVALVGESAHLFPPIGAQGLNLGLRDAVTVAEIVGDAHRAGRDIGAAGVTVTYDRDRRPDVAGRTIAVDLLNHSLLSDFLPIQSARGLGLYVLSRVGPLRRAVMREGVAPSAATPRLMRRDGDSADGR